MSLMGNSQNSWIVSLFPEEMPFPGTLNYITMCCHESFQNTHKLEKLPQ